MRVAVAGASGIGKHHAKWFAAAGAEVVAFCGSSEVSARATKSVLTELFGFHGNAYSSFAEMMAREQADILDVCTPNALHFDCARTGLRNGCHVLCEKPLVWGESDSSRMLAQADQLVHEARDRGLLFAVCTQFVAALPLYQTIIQKPPIAPAEIVEFYAEMETMAPGRLRSAQDVWIDMAPHPLSLLLAWLPTGRVRDESIRVRFEGAQACAQFEFEHPEGCCKAHIMVRDTPGETPVRRFGINGNIVECSGMPDATGKYVSVLRRGRDECRGQDFMSLLIEQFVRAIAVRAIADRGVVLPTANDAATDNLRLQLHIMGAVGES